MKVLYCRVSSLDQKTDRQKISEKEYDYVVEDKCSGSIPFFDREGGKQILHLIQKKAITSLSVLTIDRLGRNLIDILQCIKYFNENNVTINFISQGFKTLDDNGKENSVSKLMIGILGVVAEMERSQIKERQLEGIKIAKLKGVYKGRVEGSREDVLSFLTKEQNKKALEYLKKGYKALEAAKLANVHPNTITKIKKLGLVNMQSN